jgi:hypothetical protein
MLRPLLEFFLIQYTMSPAVFWAALSVTALAGGAGVIVLGLCHVSGEADDHADQMLAHLRHREVP